MITIELFIYLFLGNCQVGSCSATTGLCVYTNTCVPPADANDAACFNYVCTSGTCNKVPRFGNTNCTSSACVLNNGVYSIVTTPISCAPKNCFTQTCVESLGGCVGTALPINNTCYYCDSADGVIKAVNCPAPDLCRIAYCNASTGFACSSALKHPNNCRDPLDKVCSKTHFQFQFNFLLFLDLFFFLCFLSNCF